MRVREALVERNNVVESFDLLGGERDGEGFDVLVEMFDLTPSNDWEDIRCLVHDPSNGDCRTVIRIYE